MMIDREVIAYVQKNYPDSIEVNMEETSDYL